MKLKKNHPLASGLICSYLFNECGGNIVYDATGNRNHGTLSNVLWGKDGIETPGINEHITIPQFIAQNTDWTIFLKFTQDVRNPTTQTAQTHFMAMKDGSSGTGRSILLIEDKSGGTFKMSSYIDGTKNEADTVIVINKEYTCGLTQSGTNFKFFLDGKPDGTFIATATTCTEDIVLFDRKTFAGDGCLDGSCKVFHMYDRPLSEDEMKWLDYDPFCMFEADFKPYIFYADASISIPVFMNYYNQMRE